MDLNWLDYLETYEKEDVSNVRSIMESESQKLGKVVETVMTTHPYMTVKEACHLVETEYTTPKKAPEGIDPSWVSLNKEVVLNRLQSLTEAEIKIVIKTDDNKPQQTIISDPVSSSDADVMAIEGKRGRGRPKKVQSADDMIKKLTEMGYTVKKETIEEDKDEVDVTDLSWDDVEAVAKEEKGDSEESEESETVGDEDDSENLRDDGLDVVTADLEDDEELEEDVETITLKKPIDKIKVSAKGKINVKDTKASFAGGSIELPEETEDDE